MRRDEWSVWLPNDVAPSAFDGAVCGCLCADPECSARAAIEDASRVLSSPVDAEDERMIEFVELRRAELGAPDLVFVPCLADEDDSLSMRTTAIADWCEAFGNAFALAGVELDEAAEEALEDIALIAELDTADPDDSTVDEADTHLMEIEEHLRMAVVLIFDARAAADDAG